MFCPSLFNLFFITICAPVPIFNWEKGGLTTLSQFINMPVQYFTIMPSSCIFQILGNFIHGLQFIPLSSFFNAFSTFFTFLLFSYDLSLRLFLYKLLLLSIKHKAFSLIFLALFLIFFPRTPQDFLP